MVKRSEVLQRVRMLERTLWTQMPHMPEARLMLGVICGAVTDACMGARGVRIAAYNYLRGEIPAAQVCGVDPDWVRIVIKRLGLWPDGVSNE